jgi:hypothetical protein
MGSADNVSRRDSCFGTRESGTGPLDSIIVVVVVPQFDDYR